MEVGLYQETTIAFKVLGLLVVSGITLEVINEIRKNLRLSDTIEFVIRHPGLGIAAAGCVGVSGWFFKRYCIGTLIELLRVINNI
jgi:hypothetical protein